MKQNETKLNKIEDKNTSVKANYNPGRSVRCNIKKVEAQDN